MCQCPPLSLLLSPRPVRFLAQIHYTYPRRRTAHSKAVPHGFCRWTHRTAHRPLPQSRKQSDCIPHPAAHRLTPAVFFRHAHCDMVRSYFLQSFPASSLPPGLSPLYIRLFIHIPVPEYQGLHMLFRHPLQILSLILFFGIFH